MASLLIGILSLTLFPLVLGYSVITIRRWVEKDTDRKGTLSELVLSGVIFELATYTVIAYVCSKVSSLMTRTASIWKYYVTLELLGLILLLGVLWIRERCGKNTLLPLPGITLDMKLDREWILRFLIMGILGIVCLLLCNPIHYIPQATASLHLTAADWKLLDQWYANTALIMDRVHMMEHGKFLTLGMQIWWMIVTYMTYIHFAMKLFRDVKRQRAFLMVMSLVYLLPVFATDMDGMGFYTNIWMSSTLFCVLWAPLILWEAYNVLLAIRREDSTGTFRAGYKLAFCGAAAYSCGKIALMAVALGIAFAWLIGRGERWIHEVRI